MKRGAGSSKDKACRSMTAFEKAPSRVDRAASDDDIIGMNFESNDSTDRAQDYAEGGDREADAVASMDGAAHSQLSDEDGAHRHGHDAEGSRSAGVSVGVGDPGGGGSEAGAGSSASEDKDVCAAGGLPQPWRRAPFSRLLVFRVTYGKRNRDGRGSAAVSGHGGGRGGALECLASVALRGVCRAICQHQGYIIAACADRLCVFDLASTPAPAVAAEAAAEGESSSRRQRGGGGHARSELRLKKVAEKSMRSPNSFPVTALSADVWALAVGDAANSVNLWQLAVSAYSGHAVTGLVSSSPGCGSALYVMRRPVDVLEMSAP